MQLLTKLEILIHLLSECFHEDPRQDHKSWLKLKCEDSSDKNKLTGQHSWSADSVYDAKTECTVAHPIKKQLSHTKKTNSNFHTTWSQRTSLYLFITTRVAVLLLPSLAIKWLAFCCFGSQSQTTLAFVTALSAEEEKVRAPRQQYFTQRAVKGNRHSFVSWLPRALW